MSAQSMFNNTTVSFSWHNKILNWRHWHLSIVLGYNPHGWWWRRVIARSCWEVWRTSYQVTIKVALCCSRKDTKLVNPPGPPFPLKNNPFAQLEKSAFPLSRTSRFSFWASNFTFSLAQWARDQTSHPPTKSLKGQTKTCHGQAIFERYLSQGQVGIQVFFEPCFGNSTFLKFWLLGHPSSLDICNCFFLRLGMDCNNVM